MNKEQLRDSSVDEIAAHVENLRKELFLLRMKKTTGQLKTTHELKEVKRNIARALTILTEVAQKKTTEEGVS